MFCIFLFIEVTKFFTKNLLKKKERFCSGAENSLICNIVKYIYFK